jgi:hypothetical protein
MEEKIRIILIVFPLTTVRGLLGTKSLSILPIGTLEVKLVMIQ